MFNAGKRLATQTCKNVLLTEVAALTRTLEEVNEMVDNNDEITLAEYQSAYRAMQKRQGKIGVTIHSAVYVAVNSALAAVNLLLVPEVIWFIYPLLGWGIGLTLHYTLAVRLLDRLLKADEAKAERLAKARSIGTPRKA